MALVTRSYRGKLPVDFINSMFSGSISQTGDARSGVACAEVDETLENDINIELANRGWAIIGAGDQRPAATTFTQTYSTTTTTITAHPSWAAPGITASYSAGITLLTGASASDLNDLAGRCATLEDEVIALRGTVDQCLKLVNAVVDLLQAHGIAG